MMRRPLFVIGMIISLSTAAALVFGNNFAVAASIFLLACFPVVLLLKRWRGSALLILFWSLAAMVNVLVQNLYFVQPVQALTNHTVYLEGRVEQVDTGPSSTRYLLDAMIPMQSGKPVFTKVMVYSFTSLQVRENEGLRGYVALYNPDLTASARRSALSRGVMLYGKFEGEAVAVSSSEVRKSFGFYATDLRQTLVKLNESLLPYSASDLVNAMLLGEKEKLEESTRLAFARAGLSHLTAVSGFHLSLIVSLLCCLLEALKVPRRPRSAIALALLPLLAAAGGFSLSVLRAAIMLALCLLAGMIHQSYDGLTGLGFALSLLLFLNPQSILNAGLQLSFSATLGILVLAPRIASFFKARFPAVKGLGEKFLALLSVSLAAYLFTLPGMLYSFGTVSLVAPLASTVVMPLATAMLWSAVLAMLIASVPFLVPVAKLLSLSTRFFAALTLQSTDFFASLPFAQTAVHNEAMKLAVAVLMTGGVCLIAYSKDRKHRRAFAVFCTCILCVCGVSTALTNRNTVDIVAFEGTDVPGRGNAFIFEGKKRSAPRLGG